MAKKAESQPEGAKRVKKSGGVGRFFKRLFLWMCLLVVFAGALAAGAGLGAWYWLSKDLPRIERLSDYRPPAVTRVLARDGRLMAEYFHQRRYVIPMSQIPPHVYLAFVSAEDGDFFSHTGVDFLGIIRAAYKNFRAGRVVQGASTITQQVAKTLLLTPQRTLTRKIKEAILAQRIERSFSKEDILYLYLNQIYLGHGAWGIEAAAQTYFGKPASELDVSEAAFIAGLVKAPSRYSPVSHYRRARNRQEYVIGRMVEDGHLTQAQAEKALGRQLDIKLARPKTVDADYYAEYVRQWLLQKYGEATLYDGGLTVYTSCDPGLTADAKLAMAGGLESLTRRQGYRGPRGTAAAAELAAARTRPVRPGGLEAGQVVSGIVTGVEPNGASAQVRMGSCQGLLSKEDLAWAKRWKKPLQVGQVVRVKLQGPAGVPGVWRVELYQEPVAQSALLALETGTGRVRVMVGGRDFGQSQFNRAVQARRQPGSGFKPFIFAAALDHPVQGFTPVTEIVDAPVIYDDPGQPGAKWKPKNYENRFYGPTTLRTALEHSRNVVTVKILAKIGIPYAVDYARKFGFTSELNPNLSLALGSSGVSLMEMTEAYSVFANQGRLLPPVLVERVLDRNGDNVYDAKPEVKQVISSQTAFLMTHLLRGVIQHGTGRQMMELNRPLAGKTGTTNDLRDAWFMGYSPQMVCGVWVGQDDNQPLGRRETGARAAGPIWKKFMGLALKDLPAEDFPVPEKVVFARVDKATGRPVAPGQAGGYFEAFKEGNPARPASGRGTAHQGGQGRRRFLPGRGLRPGGQARVELTPPTRNPPLPTPARPAPRGPGRQCPCQVSVCRSGGVALRVFTPLCRLLGETCNSILGPGDFPYER